MDRVDAELLKLLQGNAGASHAEMGRSVGLSTTGVYKRLKRLEHNGYIKQYTAILSRERLGLDLLCILMVTFKTNLDMRNIRGLQEAIEHLPQVLECYTLTGSYDAVLKVAVRDHTELRAFLRTFAQAQSVVDRIQTSIVLEEVRESFALPIPAPAARAGDGRSDDALANEGPAGDEPVTRTEQPPQ